MPTRFLLFLIALLKMIACGTGVDAGLIVSVGDIQLDSSGSGQVEVFADNDGLTPPVSIASFALQLRIEPLSGNSTLRFLDDGQASAARTSRADHLFAGTTAVLFSADAFDAGRQFGIIDSVGIFDPAASVIRPSLLGVASVQLSAGTAGPSNDRFRVSVDGVDSLFFDEQFQLIDSNQITLEAGTVSVSTNVVPEPACTTFLFLMAALSSFLRRQARY
ncbi:MAG: hypothetical protein AAGA03_17960 [Planctomycetota bacterium]